MKTVKIAAVTILFLSIPHQAPMAGTSGSAGLAVPADQVGAPSEPFVARSAHQGSAAVVANEGFVWSVAATGDQEDVWSSSSDHLETDGYSWSARSADSNRVLAASQH